MLLSISVVGQQVTIPDLNLAGSDFGTTITVPISYSGISSTYGTIISATIEVTFNTTNLTYLGYSGMDPIVEAYLQAVFPNGSNGVLRFEIYDDALIPVGFTMVDESFDLSFTYNGGYSNLDLTLSYFMNLDYDEFEAPVTNGSVTGFADISAFSGDWNTAGIWTPSGNMGTLTQPGPGHNVTITTGLSPVTIGAAGVCNSLTVASGGKLTLNTGVTLTVAEDLTVQSGGSFIPIGTLAVTGAKTVEREITAANWDAPGQGYHILSSPVVDQTLTGSTDFTPTGAGNDYDFYAWDEATQYWFNQKNGAHAGMFVTFDEGKGYLAAYQATDTKVFSGEFNVADISKTGLTKSGYTDDGWHMLGNPFQSAVTWNLAEWPYSNIAATAKVWNSDGGSYDDITAGEKIPACNGFMVEAIADGASLTIPAAKRDHSSTTWYKSTEMYIKLVAHDLDNNLAQESNIRFNEAATVGYESEFDSHFLEGYAPLFFSMAAGERVSTNTLPALELNDAIPFSFVKNEGTNFSIELAEGIESNLVFIRDLKLGITYNLSENGSYSFTSETGDSPDRFEIFFGVTGIDTQNALTAARVYVANDMLIVNNVKGNTFMDILNIQGQVLNSYSFNSNGSEEFAVNLPAGIYMVRLENSNTTKTVKVFIN